MGPLLCSVWLSRLSLAALLPLLGFFLGLFPTQMKDPLGTYGVAGHYYTVLLASLAVGWDINTATNNAFFSQLPDMAYDFDAVNREAVAIGNWQGLANPEENKKEALARDEIHSGLHALTGRNAREERAHRADALRAQLPGTLGFGLAAHALGDSYSHTRLSAKDVARFARDSLAGLVPAFLRGGGSMITEAYPPASPRTYRPGLGHGHNSTWPDDIERRPQLYEEYAAALYDLFAERVGSYSGLSRDEYMAIIRQVAVSPDQDSQIELLMSAAEKIAGVRLAFEPEQHGGTLGQSVTEGLTGIDFEAVKYWQEFKNECGWSPYVPSGSVLKSEINEYAHQWRIGNWSYRGPQ